MSFHGLGPETALGHIMLTGLVLIPIILIIQVKAVDALAQQFAQPGQRLRKLKSFLWAGLALGALKLSTFADWSPHLFDWQTNGLVWTAYLLISALVSTLVVVLAYQTNRSYLLWPIFMPILGVLYAFDLSVMEYLFAKDFMVISEQMWCALFFGVAFFSIASLGQTIFANNPQEQTPIFGLSGKTLFLCSCAGLNIMIFAIQVGLMSAFDTQIVTSNRLGLIPDHVTAFYFPLLGFLVTTYAITNGVIEKKILNYQLIQTLWGGSDGRVASSVIRNFPDVLQASSIMKTAKLLALTVIKRNSANAKAIGDLAWLLQTARWGVVTTSLSFREKFGDIGRANSASLADVLGELCGKAAMSNFCAAVNHALLTREPEMRWTLKNEDSLNLGAVFDIQARFSYKTAGSLHQVQLIFTDVTSEHVYKIKAEQEQKLLVSALRIIGHDLATPLNNILLSTEVAKMALNKKTGEFSKESMHERLDRIHRTGKEMSEKLKDTLRVAKTSHVSKDLERKDVKLAKLLEDLYLIHAFRHGKTNGQFDLEIDEFAVLRDAQFFGLELVLNNILSNAVKYSKPADKARVRVHAQPLEDKAPTPQTRITVADNGPGLPNWLLTDRISAYARDQKTAHIEGQGLGLSIVEQGLNLIGAEVTFGNLVGGGAVVHIDVPYRLETTPPYKQESNQPIAAG